MAQDVVSLLFAGDSSALLEKYQHGVRRYSDAGGTAPAQVVVAHCDDGLLVTLVWGEGVDHDQLGRHMLGTLTDLGLPFPRVTHGTLATTSWAELVAEPASS